MHVQKARACVCDTFHCHFIIVVCMAAFGLPPSQCHTPKRKKNPVSQFFSLLFVFSILATHGIQLSAGRRKISWLFPTQHANTWVHSQLELWSCKSPPTSITFSFQNTLTVDLDLPFFYMGEKHFCIFVCLLLWYNIWEQHKVHTFTKAYINQVGIHPTLKRETDRLTFSYIDDALLY